MFRGLWGGWYFTTTRNEKRRGEEERGDIEKGTKRGRKLLEGKMMYCEIKNYISISR